MKKGAMLFSCIGISLCMHAQQKMQADSLGKLQDSIKMVTVTATRTSKDVMDVGRSVTVISSEQIKQASCSSVAELLSEQEGIYIVGTGQNPGSIQSLFMRGADNSNTTIMIDGVRLTDPSTDHGEIDLNELSLADVDKIEIVRGSHSTLYGSSSIGGVINIITKKNYAPGFHVTASVTEGEFGAGTSQTDANVLLNYTFKSGLYLTGGYHYEKTMGLNATVDTFTHPLSYQMNPDRDNYDKSEPFAKIGFVNNKWDVYGEYRNVIQNSDADGGPFKDLKGATDHFVRDFFTGAVNYKVNDNFNVQYLGSYSHDYRIYKQALDTVDSYGDASTENDMYVGTSMSNEIKAEYNYKASHFIIGADMYKESMNVNTYYVSYSSAFGNNIYAHSLDSTKPSQANTAVFAQADLNGGLISSKLDSLSLIIGGRYTNNSVYGGNFSYELNPSYRINKNSTVYLSYSTGFTTPSLYQLYAPNKDGDFQSTSYTLGNSKLTAETSNSFEIGLKHRVSNNVYFTLAWFKTVVNNYIDYVYLWKKDVPVDSLGYGDNLGDRYLNVGQQTTQGFELNAFVKLSSKLDVSGNISLLSSDLKYSQSTVDTSQTHGNQVQIFDGGAFLNGTNLSNTNGLLRRPGTLGNFTITYRPIKGLALTLRTRYVGSRYDAQYVPNLGPYGALGYVNIGDYTLLDAFASYDITKNIFAMLRVENIFNTQYSEILGYATRGRGVYLNLRYTL